KLHQDHPVAFGSFYATLVLLFLLFLLGIWLIWGRGPRRRRGLRAARNLLKAGDWKAALEQLTSVRAIGSPSASWTRTFDEFEGQCLQAAADAAVADKKFEEALKLGHRAAQILDEPEHEVRIKMQNAMLHEIRRLFAKTGETKAATDLVARALKVQAPCREA